MGRKIEKKQEAKRKIIQGRKGGGVTTNRKKKKKRSKEESTRTKASLLEDSKGCGKKKQTQTTKQRWPFKIKKRRET